jgi:hypothetical protein
MSTLILIQWLQKESDQALLRHDPSQKAIDVY